MVFVAALDTKGSLIQILNGPKMVMTDGNNFGSWIPVFAVDVTGSGNEVIMAETPLLCGPLNFVVLLENRKRL